MFLFKKICEFSFVCYSFTFLLSMGPFFSLNIGPFSSTSTKHAININGSNNDVWIFNGINFNITSILHQAIQNTNNAFQNTLIANNKIIIFNIMLLSTIIIILPIVILCLKSRYRQIMSNVNYKTQPTIIYVDSSNSNIPSLSKNLSSCTVGHII